MQSARVFVAKHKTGGEKSFSSPDRTEKDSQLQKKNSCFPQSETHLHQRHLGAEGQQDFFRLGGVGVVAVLVEPLLQRPRHVLQGLTLVSHFAAVGTNPAGGEGEGNHSHDQSHDEKKQPAAVIFGGC